MSNFFAYISRMKLIQRWSLMRNIRQENIQEHSHMVAVLTHALCAIDNIYFGANLDPAHGAELALYHDAGEAIIGDLPTPVKYFNPAIKEAYGKVEQIAQEKLLSMLPQKLASVYFPLINGDGSLEAYYVKAADKLSAYIKCLEELSAGNTEFEKAAASIRKDLNKYEENPAVKWFMDNCLEGFTRTLDELN